MAITASALLKPQIPLAQMFTDNSPTNYGLNNPAPSLNFLTRNQQARTAEILKDGSCVGVTAWYARLAAAEAALMSDCTVPDADGVSTLSVDYTTTQIKATKFSVTGGYCNQPDQFDDIQIALGMASAISELRGLMATYMIAAIAANAQANISGNLPAAWDDTTETPKILVPEDDFTWEMLPTFDLVRMDNYLPDDTLWLSGTLFYLDHKMQELLRANNLGAGNLAYNGMPFAHDTRYLNTALGSPGVLAVDPRSYVFWNASYSTPTPERHVHSGVETWSWFITDPQWLWNNNGRLEPVRYEVKMKETCVGVNTLGQFQYKRTYHLTFVGGVGVVPDGPDGETGILHFEVA
jgi:hypothetical protein